MTDFDLSKASDPTEVLLGRAEVRLETMRGWPIEVPNGAMSLEENKTRRQLATDSVKYFTSINKKTLLSCAFFWSAIIIPLMTAHELSTNKLTAPETALLLPLLVIGCFCAGALSSMALDTVLMKRWKSNRLQELGLEPARAMIVEDDQNVRQAYQLFSDSLTGLGKLDLSVDLELSLEDVEREFHLFLGRWQNSEDLAIRTEALKRMQRLAVQTSALLEAQVHKVKVEEVYMNAALEIEGVDLKNAILTTLDETDILMPSEESSVVLEKRNGG